MEQRSHPITVTVFDRTRLRGLLRLLRTRYRRTAPALDEFERELERAVAVDPQQVPPSVITMNSRVRLADLDSGARYDLTLVFPGAGKIIDGCVSVLAPLGRALLGRRETQMLEWPSPHRLRRLLVEQVVYQPEASGHLQR